MHEGAVSAELGFAGYPSVAESVMVERDLALAAYERQPLHLLHLSARESVEALAAARAAGVAGDRRGDAAPPRADRRGGALARPEPEDEPAAARADDRAALIEALRDGTITAIATDHAPHARHEKDVPFEEAPFGVTGLETAFAALYTHLVEPGLLPLATLLERMSAGPARAYGLEPPRIAVGAPREPRPARPRGDLAGRGGRLPLALGELVAARRDADGKVRLTVAAGRIAA